MRPGAPLPRTRQLDAEPDCRERACSHQPRRTGSVETTANLNGMHAVPVKCTSRGRFLRWLEPRSTHTAAAKHVGSLRKLMAAEEAQEPLRPVAAADVTACAIQSWYPTFKKHTIRTVLLELNADFLKYLDADGIVLPTPIGPCAEGDPRAAVSSPRSSTSSEEGAGGSSSGASEAPPDRAVSFPALERSIQAALDTMPRGAFVKTSWSSVQDAVWASGTLQCTTPGEVFMLLKCSDMVAFDMHKACVPALPH